VYFILYLDILQTDIFFTTCSVDLLKWMWTKGVDKASPKASFSGNLH